MKRLLAFSIILLGFSNVYSQSTQPNPDNDKVFTIVQQKPEFPGSINDWLAQNIIYPIDAKNSNIQGTVYISFIVERDGSVSGAKVIRGVQSSLDNEALRVIAAMPKWTPGMQNGHSVRVQYMVPIHYVLKDNNSSIPKNN